MSKIVKPKWVGDAKLTTCGWVKGNELLKAMKVTQEEVDMYEQKMNSEMVSLNEAPANNVPLQTMNEEDVKSIQTPVTEAATKQTKSRKRRSKSKSSS